MYMQITKSDLGFLIIGASKNKDYLINIDLCEYKFLGEITDLEFERIIKEIKPSVIYCEWDLLKELPYGFVKSIEDKVVS